MGKGRNCKFSLGRTVLNCPWDIQIERTPVSRSLMYGLGAAAEYEEKRWGGGVKRETKNDNTKSERRISHKR